MLMPKKCWECEHRKELDPEECSKQYCEECEVTKETKSTRGEEQMQLISFKEEQIKEVLKLIGITTDYEIIGNCETCKKDLKLNNIGVIARGKDKPELYCDNPACFSIKIAEKELNKSKGEKNK